ncbi:Calmodulin-like protein 11 [Bienertia sinuspersici]
MVWGIGSHKRNGAANASTSSTGAIPQLTMPTLGIVFQKREHQQRFVSLLSRKIMSTKFFDGQALEALGCRQQVTQLLSNLGWANFITYRDYTYKRLTLEFLATLETNSTPNELNTIFRWPTDAEYGPMGFWAIEDCDADLFWQGISGEESFNSRSSKASWIVSPVLRIVHRLLVMALFQKQEIGAITKDELRVIWLSLQNPTQYHALNNGAYLLDRHSADVDSDPRGPVDTDILLDLGAMRSMEFFQGNRAMRPPFKWLVRGKEWMMVPSPHNHFESLRRDMDVLNRVAWRNHLANVYHGLALGFPNHPMYPPSFDPTPGPFAEPRFSTSYYPYHAPYFPPPEGNDDDDA